MIWIDFVLAGYIILFCLGFYTDYKLSTESKNKYWLFSLPLTAPIIGAKIILSRVKVIA
jgi:hypothetical protein